jgi:ABC-type histidine transport system ATPase subunit
MKVIPMVTDAEVLKRWKYIAQDEEKLLIIIGGPGSGKSRLIRELTYQEGWKIVDAKELFDDEFLEIPRADRPEQAISLISAAIHRLNARVVMIDNVGFLFAPILNLNPIKMLKHLSHECPLIVSWRGHIEKDTLYFEHNGDPKYAKFKVENKNHVISLD